MLMLLLEPKYLMSPFLKWNFIDIDRNINKPVGKRVIKFNQN